jgi:hypothetical protein
MEWIPMYGSNPRTTLDGEWTEDELMDDVDDECAKLVIVYNKRLEGRALYDQTLLIPRVLAEKVRCNNDLIEVYNKCADAHRDENRFGIHWFDDWVRSEVKKIMNANLVTGGDIV